MAVKVDIDYAISAPLKKNCPTKKEFTEWVTAALPKDKKLALVSLRIMDNEEMRELNNQFRKKDKPTNVLSFPSQLPAHLSNHHLGDIALCASVIEQEAIEQHKSLTSHWAHMVVHGVLHLLGHDHEKEEEASIMEKLEVEILKKLGFGSPYQVEYHE